MLTENATEVLMQHNIWSESVSTLQVFSLARQRSVRNLRTFASANTSNNSLHLKHNTSKHVMARCHIVKLRRGRIVSMTDESKSRTYINVTVCGFERWNVKYCFGLLLPMKNNTRYFRKTNIDNIHVWCLLCHEA